MELSRRDLLKGSAATLAVAPFLTAAQTPTGAMGNAKFVDVDGIRTRYFEAGSGENLVLIHGGRFGFPSYSADVWGLNFEGLSRHFHVYAFDKLGMGYTDNPKSDADYSKSAMIRHAYGFIRKMGIQRTSLMGHSMGAFVVARIAVEHPELVKCLIPLDSNTLAPEDPSTPRDFYDKIVAGEPPVPTAEYVRREPDANSYSNAHVTSEYVQEILRIALLPKTKEATDKAKVLNPQFFADLQRLKPETLDWIRAGRLKAPTLILWGFNDPSAPVILGMHLLKVIAPAVPRTGFHVFNQAGHYVFRERAPEMNRLVTDFIKNSPAV
ncbi:MAG: alpha/beta hydrolase [Acidobacteria bacterium]|nr:alpha/beta hydrolase [Acidobacteriota bacterium]